MADASKPDLISLPSINQIDLHPFMSRAEIVDICRKNGIHLEAVSLPFPRRFCVVLLFFKSDDRCVDAP